MAINKPRALRAATGEPSSEGHYILVKQRGRIGNRFDAHGRPNPRGKFHLRRLPEIVIERKKRVSLLKAERLTRRKLAIRAKKAEIKKRNAKRRKKEKRRTKKKRREQLSGLPQEDAPEGVPTERGGADYFTYFKAAGTFGSYDTLTRTKARKGYSPDILTGNAEDYGSEYGAPAAFFSQQSLILGQVRWNGILSLEQMIDALNKRLQFLGEERDDFDFRRVYPVWSYEFFNLEKIGVKKTKFNSKSKSKSKRSGF